MAIPVGHFGPADPERHYVRAHVTLAQNEVHELRLFDPKATDESSSLVSTLAKLDPRSEWLTIAIDLRPLLPAQARAHKMRSGQTNNGGWVRKAVLAGDDLLQELVAGPGQNRSQRSTSGSLEDQVARLDQSMRARQQVKSIHTASPLFEVRILLRAEASTPGRAKQIIKDALVGLRPFASENQWFKVRGVELAGRYGGTDLLPWTRRRFDRSLEEYRWMRSRHPAITSSSSIAALISPPTQTNFGPSIRRSGGIVPAPPLQLRTFNYQPDQIPLGIVRNPDGSQRVAALSTNDTLFTATFGATGMGKTENVKTQFGWWVKTGNGGLFLDPHEDAIRDLKGFLVDQGDRIVEVSTVQEQHQMRAGVNPFDVTGLTPPDIEGRNENTINALSEAFRWTSTYTRGLMLLTTTVRTLLEISRRVPADCAPTLFQILPLLEDQLWREEVVKYLPEGDLRDFWMNIDDRFTSEHLSVLTGPIRRMRQTGVYLHILGQSESTFSFRDAMDNRKIVFLKTSADGESGKALVSFIVGGLMEAFRSRLREDNAPRNPFRCDFDEVPDYEEAIRRLLVQALQQYRKAGARLGLMAQQPDALHKDTLGPLLNNASAVNTGRINYEGGSIISKRFGKKVAPEAMTDIERYAFMTMVTKEDGQMSPPFKVRGLQPADILGPPETDPERLAALDRQIAANSGMKSFDAVVEAQTTLNQRILTALSESRERQQVVVDPGREQDNVVPMRQEKRAFSYD